jgi:hypothetical protein
MKARTRHTAAAFRVVSRGGLLAWELTVAALRRRHSVGSRVESTLRTTSTV